jgi:hypothetical protein
LVRPLGATHAYSNRVAAAVLTAQQTNVYEVLIRNDGLGAEKFYPAATRANLYFTFSFFGGSGDIHSLTNWRVAWYDTIGNDVTPLMDCGWWWTPTLWPDQYQYYRVAISPSRQVSGGHGMRLSLRARTADRSVSDSIHIDVTKKNYWPELWISPDHVTYNPMFERAEVQKVAGANYAASYYFKLRNGGDANDRLTLKAAVSGVAGGTWDATFHDLDAPGEITSSVLGSGWTTAWMAGGAERHVRLDLCPLGGAVAGQTCVVTCALSSWGDAWPTNTARALGTLGLPNVQVQGQVAEGSWQDQRVTARIPSLHTTSFTVRVTNRGAFADRFNLNVYETNQAGWNLYYYDAYGNNITFMLYDGSYSTDVIAPEGGYADFQVTLQPDSGLANNAMGSTRITAISQNNASVSGQVWVAGIRSAYRAELFARPSSDEIYRQGSVSNSCGMFRTAVFFVNARNYGETTDGFLMNASFSAPSSGETNWNVQYFSDPDGLTNVTSQITGGGWTAENLDPESSSTLRVDVWASNNVPGESEGVITMDARSVGSIHATSRVVLVTQKAGSRPAVLVRNAEGGAYGAEMASQRVASATASFDFLVRNDGDDDVLVVSNEVQFTAWGTWTLRVLDMNADGADVTDLLEAGLGYPLASGESRTFRVEATPGNDVPPDAICQCMLRAVSQADPNWFSDGIALTYKANCGVELRVWNDYYGAYTNVASDVKALPASPGVYYWEVKNTGEIPDYVNVLAYHASDDYSGWNVRYFNNSTGGDDITPWILSEPGAKLGPLTPGMSYYFRSEAAPAVTVDTGSTCAIFMRADADGYLGSVQYLAASDVLRSVGQFDTRLGVQSDFEFTGHTVTQSMNIGETATFVLLLVNRSAAHDTFQVIADPAWGGGEPAHWTIRAFNDRYAGDDVTDLLLNGTLGYGPFAKDNGGFMRLEVTPLPSASENEIITLHLAASSMGESSATGEALAETHVLGRISIQITKCAMDAGTRQLVLEWDSEPGAYYEIQAVTELGDEAIYTPLVQNIEAHSSVTRTNVTTEEKAARFYRIHRPK